jgi:hypothetical protein
MRNFHKIQFLLISSLCVALAGPRSANSQSTIHDAGDHLVGVLLALTDDNVQVQNLAAITLAHLINSRDAADTAELSLSQWNSVLTGIPKLVSILANNTGLSDYDRAEIVRAAANTPDPTTRQALVNYVRAFMPDVRIWPRVMFEMTLNDLGGVTEKKAARADFMEYLSKGITDEELFGHVYGGEMSDVRSPALELMSRDIARFMDAQNDSAPADGIGEPRYFPTNITLDKLRRSEPDERTILEEIDISIRWGTDAEKDKAISALAYFLIDNGEQLDRVNRAADGSRDCTPPVSLLTSLQRKVLARAMQTYIKAKESHADNFDPDVLEAICFLGGSDEASFVEDEMQRAFESGETFFPSTVTDETIMRMLPNDAKKVAFIQEVVDYYSSITDAPSGKYFQWYPFVVASNDKQDNARLASALELALSKTASLRDLQAALALAEIQIGQEHQQLLAGDILASDLEKGFSPEDFVYRENFSQYFSSQAARTSVVQDMIEAMKGGSLLLPSHIIAQLGSDDDKSAAADIFVGWLTEQIGDGSISDDDLDALRTLLPQPQFERSIDKLLKDCETKAGDKKAGVLEDLWAIAPYCTDSQKASLAQELLYVLEALQSDQDAVKFVNNGKAARLLSALPSDREKEVALKLLLTTLLVEESIDTASLEPLSAAPVTALLEIPYDHTDETPQARWLAYYLSNGSDSVHTQLDYLANPAHDPSTPTGKSKVLNVVNDLMSVAAVADSGKLREDAAWWISWFVLEDRITWDKPDVPELQQIEGQLLSESELSGNRRIASAAAGVQAVIATLTQEIEPAPWARSCIAFLLICLLALAVYSVPLGRTEFSRWLPFGSYAITGIASCGTSWVTQLHLNVPLLALLLVTGLVGLMIAGLASPELLRQLASTEPIKRIIVPLAIRAPMTRRRIFAGHVAQLRNQLDRDKRYANSETYIGLPAAIRKYDDKEVRFCQQPANSALTFAMESRAARVLVEAPGGSGKSALMREILRIAIEKFVAFPSTMPVPVLVSGAGGDFKKLARDAIGGAVLSEEMFELQLENGDFLFFLDGLSETGATPEELRIFLGTNSGRLTPMVLSARDTAKGFRYVIEGTASWMIIEPLRLVVASPSGINTLSLFIDNYNGSQSLDDYEVARRPDATYLPLLVRMVIEVRSDTANIDHPSNSSRRAPLCDVYYKYFYKLFSSLGDDGKKIAFLDDVGRWCVKTYWRDGQRIRGFRGEAIEQLLLDAGALIPAGGDRPVKEIRFFHDSMQSFLTAWGLAEFDRLDYRDFPLPLDAPHEGHWSRERVLLWTAANRKFVESGSDLLLKSGSELFQMSLVTFGDGDSLILWLRDELRRWAQDFTEDIPRREILNALPNELAHELANHRSRDRLILEAIAQCQKRKQEELFLLGSLYSGLAQLIYKYTENPQTQ